jgi:hypothetical protein
MARSALAFRQLQNLVMAPAQIRSGFGACHVTIFPSSKFTLGPRAYGEVTR